MVYPLKSTKFMARHHMIISVHQPLPKFSFWKYGFIFCGAKVGYNKLLWNNAGIVYFSCRQNNYKFELLFLSCLVYFL